MEKAIEHYQQALVIGGEIKDPQIVTKVEAALVRLQGGKAE